jgi:hypothetical protein
MSTFRRLALACGLIATINAAHAQAPNPKVEKDCINLSPQARQECLKVAKEMDRKATEPQQPATRPDSGNSPSPNTVQHSSPVMQTPHEIKANAKKPAPGSDTQPPR